LPFVVCGCVTGVCAYVAIGAGVECADHSRDVGANGTADACVRRSQPDSHWRRDLASHACERQRAGLEATSRDRAVAGRCAIEQSERNVVFARNVACAHTKI